MRTNAERIADAASPRVLDDTIGGIIPRRRETMPERRYVRFQSGCRRTRARLIVALSIEAGR